MLYIERVFAIYQPSLTAVRNLLIRGHEHKFPSFLYQFCDYHELSWDWVEYTVSMDRLFPQSHFCEELEEDMATIMWQHCVFFLMRGIPFQISIRWKLIIYRQKHTEHGLIKMYLRVVNILLEHHSTTQAQPWLFTCTCFVIKHLLLNDCIYEFSGNLRNQQELILSGLVHEMWLGQKCFFFPGQMGGRTIGPGGRTIGPERRGVFSDAVASTAGTSGAATSLFTTGASFGTATTSADSLDSAESRPLAKGSWNAVSLWCLRLWMVGLCWGPKVCACRSCWTRTVALLAWVCHE